LSGNSRVMLTYWFI